MKASSKIIAMAQLSDQSDFLKTALRLPRDLHARIQQAAEASGRSMNAEIVARLQQSFDQADAPAAPSSALLKAVLTSPVFAEQLREQLEAMSMHVLVNERDEIVRRTVEQLRAERVKQGE